MTFRRFLFCFMLIFFMTGTSYATSISVGDMVDIDFSNSLGTTVQEVSLAGSYTGQSWVGALYASIGSVDQFLYCIDYDTSINQNQDYYINNILDTGTYTDGFYSYTGNAVYAAWLVDNFGSQVNDDNTAAALQLAIWSALYNYTGSDFGGTAFSYIATDAITLQASSYITALTGSLNSISLSTTYAVADLMNDSGDAQDMLISNPVPEPATMLLLGTGLLGIAGVGSRKKRAGKVQK